MFTGIVESRGVVESIARALPDRGVIRLTINTDLDVAALPLGASIAVDGVCLTVVQRQRVSATISKFAADLGPETLALTTLGALERGSEVHLERPLRMGDPLGGHLVAGHVDGIGTVTGIRERGQALELDIQAPASVGRFASSKGSIAVDGVSLTINSVAGDTFSVTLIPHTLEVTHLGGKVLGSTVNLEADLIAKHIERLMEPYLGGGSERGGASHTPRREISVEMLRRYGFVR
jgi:riboflavin synthase